MVAQASGRRIRRSQLSQRSFGGMRCNSMVNGTLKRWKRFAKWDAKSFWLWIDTLEKLTKLPLTWVKLLLPNQPNPRIHFGSALRNWLKPMDTLTWLTSLLRSAMIVWFLLCASKGVTWNLMDTVVMDVRVHWWLWESSNSWKELGSTTPSTFCQPSVSSALVQEYWWVSRIVFFRVPTGGRGVGSLKIVVDLEENSGMVILSVT